jgi:hypothetical protein
MLETVTAKRIASRIEGLKPPETSIDNQNFALFFHSLVT